MYAHTHTHTQRERERERERESTCKSVLENVSKHSTFKRENGFAERLIFILT